MSRYEVQLAVAEDVPEVANVDIAAFEDNPLMRSINGQVDRQLKHESIVKAASIEIENRYLLGCCYYKCVEKESGKIVAYARWDSPVKLTEAEEEKKSALQARMRVVGTSQGSNLSLLQDFGSKREAARAKWYDPSSDYDLRILGTLPEYQRRGLGTMLLEAGLRQADRDGAKVYIEASPVGLLLYLRHGFEVVDEISLDMSQHGLPELGTISLKCLVRPPEGKM